MYTLHMAWPFRVLVLFVVLGWGIAPQFICFLPDNASEAEKDCCEKMAGECGQTQMTHECCRPEVRTEVGVAAKVIRNNVTVSETAERTFHIPEALRSSGFISSIEIDRPPDKPLLSTSILRI